MKHYKRFNTYKNSSGTNEYKPETREAWSYRWWQYVKQFDINGRKITVFNRAGYSSTTIGHQSETRSLMRELGHEIDFEVVCPEGLHVGLESSLKHYKYVIADRIEAIKKPKSRRSSNLERIKYIKEDLKTIDFLLKNKLVETNFETTAEIYKAENFCANVLVNQGKFIE